MTRPLSEEAISRGENMMLPSVEADASPQESSMAVEASRHVAPPEWQPIEIAPRNGTEILVCRDNGCTWDFRTVWWSEWNDKYPWSSDFSRYPEEHFDYWMPIPQPPTSPDQLSPSVSDSNPEGRDIGLGAKPASAMTEGQTPNPNPLPADHAEVVDKLKSSQLWLPGNILDLAATLITSQAEEIERLTKERDEARIWHEKAHTFLEERNAYKHRAEAAESSLSSMTERYKELEEALNAIRREADKSKRLARRKVKQALAEQDEECAAYSNARLDEAIEMNAVIARALSQTTKEGTDAALSQKE